MQLTQRHWLEHLRACEASGKGIAAYASEHGIEAKALYAGKKVLVKKGVLPRTRPSRFQRAQVNGPVAGATWRIQLPNGLSVLVEEVLQHDPFSEQLFVFCNRKRDKIKILYWERSGFCLWQKCLERARFKWPRKVDTEVFTLTGQQLNWLLDGYDVMRMQAHERLHFSSVL